MNCHCGKPLHYDNYDIKEAVEDLISFKGEYVKVRSICTEKTYLVPRHYIALHGIKERLLDTYGFEEVKEKVK